MYGLAAVAMGALGAHLLGERLAVHHGTANFDRAKLYFFVHALILAVVTVHLTYRPGRLAGIAGLCFVLGTLCFAGSLLVLSLTGWRPVTQVTPAGGILLMIGWIVWGLAAAAPSTGNTDHAD